RMTGAASDVEHDRARLLADRQSQPLEIRSVRVDRTGHIVVRGAAELRGRDLRLIHERSSRRSLSGTIETARCWDKTGRYPGIKRMGCWAAGRSPFFSDQQPSAQQPYVPFQFSSLSRLFYSRASRAACASSSRHAARYAAADARTSARGSRATSRTES